tara:strand:+ start:1870 stop:2100 length:231 start_codon:yes stop_codon:yes gene_type:complete
MSLENEAYERVYGTTSEKLKGRPSVPMPFFSTLEIGNSEGRTPILLQNLGGEQIIASTGLRVDDYEFDFETEISTL